MNIVGVGDVQSSLLEIRVLFSLIENFLSGGLILLEHLNGEDVVDLDIMSRDSVVQETGWEHHVVSGVPELWVVLVVEGHVVSDATETESGDDGRSQETPHVEAGVVQGTI